MIEAVLFVFLIAVAVFVARSTNLFSAAMVFAIFSLLSAGMLTMMDAVDVAFTEAAVGAGVSTVLILGALARTSSEEKPPRRRALLPLLVVVATGAMLIWGTLDMPRYGDPEAPINRHVAPHYLHGSAREIGIPNIVTSILASYRSYDTFGETTVILTAAVGALLLLGGRRSSDPEREQGRGRRAGRESTPLRLHENPVLRVTSKALIPFILLFALYVQFHGDYGPGGGFQAGVIFAAGLFVYGLVFGPRALETAIPRGLVERGIALGVLIYGGVGLFSLFSHGEFLNFNVLDPQSPVHGQHRGIFLVELGVGITVASVMTAIFYAFAGRSPE